MGEAMKHDIKTSTTKSFESSLQRLDMEAPKTFRIPISFTRCSAINDANPKSPRKLIKIARIANIPESLPT